MAKMNRVSRVAEVNRALKLRGVEERLKSGGSYYYFTGGMSHTWETSGVMVYRADELSVDEWLEEYDRLACAHEWVCTRCGAQRF